MALVSFRALASASLISAGLVVGSASASHAQVRSFVPVSRHVVDGSVAEIISATPDGTILAYTNAGDQVVGLIDMSDPTNLVELGTIDVSDLGEPTSVAITPNGQYAIAAVLNIADIPDQQPGHLVFIDIATRQRVGQVQLAGIGPDSIAITPDGSTVVVAIEDEEDEDNQPGDRPGAVNLVTIDYANPAESTVTEVALDLTDTPGVNYPTDPQPEFVAISRDGQMAAVTIQENNAIALIDISSASVLRMFSAGTSVHERADLVEDGDIRLVQPFEGRREPDAISFTPDGQHLVIVNEGDTDLERFGDGVSSGGRGWSILDLEGNVVYDSGSSAEELAVWHGQYPEGRSEARGIEMEGGTVAQFGEDSFAFVASERGSFLLVYNINDVENPRLVNFLPTGMSPEGVLAIPSRNLVLTANETDGTIDVFQGSPFLNTGATAASPLISSSSLSTPFSAISGMVVDTDNPNVIYAVPDNAMAPSRIFTLNLLGPRATVVTARTLTQNGEPVSYDLEGIAHHAEGGFWLVSEGDDREGQESPNLLIQVDAMGAVVEEITLPAAEAEAITRFGFEGVTTSTDGNTVYIAMQREFEGDGENLVRIGAYDVATETWSYYFYPLDTDNVEESWVGLSEIALDTDGSFLVVERDNQGGANGAANARIKRVYRFSLEGVEPGETVEKTLVTDLLSDYAWLEEKVESLAVTEDGYWLASDNDGGEWYTRLLFISR